MYYFCTLFDTNYLSRGLALYDSLRRHLGEQFHLYIFPFDEATFDVLKALELPQVTLIVQSAFEDEALLQVKANRTKGEYCWTCTPAVIAYALKHFKLPHCTYLDADIYFFDSPLLILNAIGSNDVVITEHRFAAQYEQSNKVGRFCVQFMYFNNSENALNILDTWRNNCIEWCFDKVENGKFGDQKYLDVWPAQYKGIFIPDHIGAGVAPWNLRQYIVKRIQDKPFVYDPKRLQAFPIIFYHFHGLKFIDAHQIDMGGYRLSQRAIDAIYRPYWLKLKEVEQQLLSLKFDLNFHGIRPKQSQSDFLPDLKRKLTQTYNIVSI